MAAPSGSEFDSWLSGKLTKLNADVDLEVFVSYIRGILEEDSSDEEKGESVEGFLAEITDEDLTPHVKDILDKWMSLDGADVAAAAMVITAGQKSIDEKLAGIMEAQKKTLVKPKTVTEEDRKRKEAILKQYAQVSDGDESDDAIDADVAAASATPKGPPAGGVGKEKDEDLLVKNMNALLVSERDKNQRETERLEAAKKKEKDKSDREKQKQKAQDRKESEKKRTQKGEKRR